MLSQVSCQTVMLDVIDSFLSTVSGCLWGYVLVFALLGVHLYLTLVLRVPQRYLFRGIAYSLRRKAEGNSISHYGALAVSLAASIGTGNIVGVAVALASGGPGAVFWCVITGLLGMASRYAESLLAVRFRRLDSRGNLVGGPMYAIEHGMKCKWLAVLFAVFTAIAAFGGESSSRIRIRSVRRTTNWNK